MRKNDFFKMFKGSKELFISIVSEQNKMIKFNEHLNLSCVNLSEFEFCGYVVSLFNPRLEIYSIPLHFCHLITRIYIFMDVKF